MLGSGARGALGDSAVPHKGSGSGSGTLGTWGVARVQPWPPIPARTPGKLAPGPESRLPAGLLPFSPAVPEVRASLPSPAARRICHLGWGADGVQCEDESFSVSLGTP